MLKRIGLATGAAAKAVARSIPAIVLDLAGLAAVGSISYGAWLIYEPAGFITGGTLALIGVVLLATKR